MKRYKRIIQYSVRRQLNGCFCVVERSCLEDGSSPRKRTLRKNMTMMEAEELTYILESRKTIKQL